jgi:hypothetical protein
MVVPPSPVSELTLSEKDVRDFYKVQYVKTNLRSGPSHKVLPVRFQVTGRDGQTVSPNTEGLSHRTQYGNTWRTLKWKDTKGPLKTSSIGGKLQNEMDVLNSYWGWVGTIDPEYNLLEPYTLLDTESYLKQALMRKHSLMFRNGIKFIGENQSFVEYAEKRSNQIGYVMGVTWQSLLKDIVWNLLVCSNCVVIKIRDDDASGGTANDKNNNRTPIAAYTIVPPHSIYPYLDGKGRIEKWRRFFKNGKPYKDYPVEDVIHFKWDVKPGHIFGTPRTVPVVDDIYALRRLEENAELLLIHHLFPMVHIKVGTPEAPCEYYPDGGSEIDYIKSQIMSMPKEGVFVTDERVDLEVNGANGQGVPPDKLLEHYKKRIYIGLGVSGIDLGEADTANRATAENVSQNLKDQVKSDLDTFVDQVRMAMLKDWFQESPTQLSVQNAVSDVKLEFHEIDIDGQIKQENHALNLWNNHLLDQDETRKRLKHKPLSKDTERGTHFYKHEVELTKIQHNQAKDLAKLNNELNPPAAATGPTRKTTIKKSHSRSANGGVSKSHTKTVEEPAGPKAASKGKKAVATKSQPENQHGKNMDPHKARSSALRSELYHSLVDGLDELPTPNVWEEIVTDILDIFLQDTPEHKEILKQILTTTRDRDVIFSTLGILG